jgi:ubiquinone/menaquinone biosynthesis C-methylase UbiE
MVTMSDTESQNAKLDQYAKRIEIAISNAKELLGERKHEKIIPDFDIRGPLYELALELSPHARENDISAMRDFVRARQNEQSVDIAAGTGFLSKPLSEWTNSTVFAIDPSKEQLNSLRRHCTKLVRPILGSPDDVAILNAIPQNQIDLITSFGGIHHVHDQRTMFANIASMLKEGGRFSGADVESNTALSKHFDDYVSKKCLTGHEAQWISRIRLADLCQNTPLSVRRTENKALQWVFNSEREMALFFKGLHAYDLPEGEIINDLKTALGTEKRGEHIYLNWPMIFFEIVKS